MSELTGVTDRYAIYLAIGLSLIILFTPGSDNRLPVVGLDKLIHFAIFSFLAITANWRFGRFVPIAVALMLYAVFSEVIQHFWIPGREFDLIDIAADCAGAFGLLAFQASNRIKQGGNR